MAELKAVLFDLDGVLVDSHCLHYESWRVLSAKLGLSITREQGEDFRGMAREECLKRLFTVFNSKPLPSPEEAKRLTDEKNAIYLDILHKSRPEDLLLPGALTLLENLQREGIKAVVASGSKNAKDVIACAGFGDKLYAIVDRSDIVKTKPAPDIFLKAQEVSGAKPEEVVGVEDAILGIEALKAAGFKSAGVGPYVKGADLYRPSLVELTVDDLRSLVKDL